MAGHAGRVTGLSLSGDGRLVASASQDRTARIRGDGTVRRFG
jgi:WD40 repeat protein